MLLKHIGSSFEVYQCFHQRWKPHDLPSRKKKNLFPWSDSPIVVSYHSKLVRVAWGTLPEDFLVYRCLRPLFFHKVTFGLFIIGLPEDSTWGLFIIGLPEDSTWGLFGIGNRCFRPTFNKFNSPCVVSGKLFRMI